MASAPPARAIIFDAYGTLFDIAAIDERLVHHFGEKAAGIASVWRRKQLEYTWLRSLMGRYKDFYTLTQDALRFACRAADLSLGEAVATDLMEHYDQLRIYSEVKEALGLLRQNFKTAILSNANPDLLEKAVAFNRIGPLLDGIFSADAIRKYKPAPAVYALPGDGFQISNEEMIFLSGNTWDVAGARSAGLRVAWVRRKPDHLEELGFQPDLIVSDLLEFVQGVKGEG